MSGTINKTTFRILKMDCPSEEQIIRMKLNGLSDIQSLQFDIPSRHLTVFHSGGYDQIFQQLDSLNLDTSLLESETTEHITGQVSDKEEKKLLWMVLAINFFFFVLEMLTGFLASSMGLVADSLDMLADSIVYGLALWVVGGSAMRKKRIAKVSGYFQLTLAILGFSEVIRRFIGFELVPVFQTMIIISILALIGNVASLYLLQTSKSKEAHMQASMIFTSNDVVVNLGVIAAGVLVFLTDSVYPDLIIGIIVFIIVGRGAFRILQLAR